MLHRLESAPARIGAAGVLMLTALAGGYVLSSRQHVGNSMVVSADAPATVLAQSVVVQVAGAVRKPGLLRLKTGARVADAVEAAGGETRDADLGQLILAEPLLDGSKITVPKFGQDLEAPLVTTSSAPPAGIMSRPSTTHMSGSSSPSTPLAPGSISLNRATLADLDRLPGVGPSTAQKILEFRAQAGGFKSIEQLMDVKGIGPKKFEKMRPYLSL